VDGGATLRSLTVASGVALPPDLRAGLDRLQSRASPPNVFHDPDLIAAATAVVGPVTLHWLQQDADILAALPVERRRLGLGLSGKLPHGLAHAFGPAGTPLVMPDIAPAELARLLLAARGAASVLVLPFIEVGSVTAATLVAAAEVAGEKTAWFGRHGRAGLDFSANAHCDPIAAISAKRRKEWGRIARRMADHGAVDYRRDTAPEAVAAAYDDVVALEARGWKGRRATALLLDPRGRAFGAAALAALAARDAVVIDRLTVGGVAVAGLISFRMAGRWWIWKTAYDEAFAHHSPGVQLMLKVTGALARDDSLTSADSLATPDHPMIDALWPGRIEVGTLLIGPQRGVKWAALELAAEATLRRWARRVLKR
jgi:CelD/BcsL family acetyltransferase involved in cellulose biosynthesis